MKCPKCSYVGYEATDRCRHCGYDFSLTLAEPASPAPVARMEPVPLPSIARERLAAPTPPEPAAVVDLPLQVTDPLDVATSATERFAEPPPPAGAPLAVRRTTERVRSRGTGPVKRPRPALLDAVQEETGTDAPADAPGVLASDSAAPPVARLLSAILDVLLLLVIDASVVYFTAKIANIPLAEIVLLPLAPLATFLVGLNVAYLTVFTANGGQTLGKMAAGLRVEGTDGPLTFGDATVRVVVAILGGLVAGAGFLPALWRHDRRAVHDQIAHTRVVKVAA
ncbi:MAG: RDD family protein [Vicinamibacterales bacterium]